MARIPLQVASRSLDTGGVVQYPSGSPLGAAMEGFGDALQRAAAHRRALDEKQDAFDAAILDDEFRATLAQQETDALEKAPADGKGLHDQVYGELDPATNQPRKPGLFDQLFDKFLQRVPESQRQKWAAQRDTLRIRGSTRLAGVQYDKRVAYEAVEVAKAEDKFLNEIIQADPDDKAAFEQFKKAGADLIANMTDPLEREKAAYNWEQKSAKALAQAMINKDPSQVRALLGMEPRVQPAPMPANVSDRASAAMRFYQSRGYTREQAAGIVGNLVGESKLNTGALNPGDGVDGSNSIGIGQWNGDRARALKRFAAANHADWRDFNVQLAFVDHELRTTESAAGSALKGARTVEEATAAFIGYERPAGWSAQNPRGGHNYKGRLAYAKSAAGDGANFGEDFPTDPRLAGLSPDDRLILANQADSAMADLMAKQKADLAAEYATYKDRFELGVVDGSIRDEALILNDSLLKDGDKATLVRSLRAQNETAGQIQADLAALASGNLAVDPYSTDGKKRVDNLYSDYIKRNGQDEGGVVAAQIVSQTGAVPQPVVNSLRGGIDSRDPGTVAQALQLAQKFSAIDPAALSRREGGGEVQTAADDFAHYVNDLNMDPNAAAQRIIDARDPAKQRERKALEPAAKEFMKELDTYDLAGAFNDTWFSGDPAIGFNAQQMYGITAEFKAIAEEQFYKANGDPELAKTRALAEMKRLYGVTDLTGNRTVMKHPPERYWPKSILGVETGVTISGGGGQGPGNVMSTGPAEPSLDYAWEQLQADIRTLYPDADTTSVQLVTTPETDAMVKRGELPGYAVLYKDRNGVLQTLPGKLWRPDVTKAEEVQKQQDAADQAEREKRARWQQEDMRDKAERMQSEDGGRGEVLDRFLYGDPLTGQMPVDR